MGPRRGARASGGETRAGAPARQSLTSSRPRASAPRRTPGAASRRWGLALPPGRRAGKRRRSPPCTRQCATPTGPRPLAAAAPLACARPKTGRSTWPRPGPRASPPPAASGCRIRGCRWRRGAPRMRPRGRRSRPLKLYRGGVAQRDGDEDAIVAGDRELLARVGGHGRQGLPAGQRLRAAPVAQGRSGVLGHHRLRGGRVAQQPQRAVKDLQRDGGHGQHRRLEHLRRPLEHVRDGSSHAGGPGELRQSLGVLRRGDRHAEVRAGDLQQQVLHGVREVRHQHVPFLVAHVRKGPRHGDGALGHLLVRPGAVLLRREQRQRARTPGRVAVHQGGQRVHAARAAGAIGRNCAQAAPDPGRQGRGHIAAAAWSRPGARGGPDLPRWMEGEDEQENEEAVGPPVHQEGPARQHLEPQRPLGTGGIPHGAGRGRGHDAP
ncbi:unnamed protein product [Prorocentrum cordatum]|uniref:Uncharacterized protein n=1 Tax=Prorocentrum cordatum TaxID=2364126 RepID=A0ABN9XAB7_9DINO|nr:unnamed protein product [Polarella glacialis]